MTYSVDKTRMIQKMNLSFYKRVNTIFNQFNKNDFDLNVTKIVLTGNLEIARDILASRIKHENYGFNQLHLDALTLDKIE